MSRTFSLAVSLSCGLALASFAAGCGTTSEAAPTPPATPAAPPAAGPDAEATCVEVMTRNRVCTDEFIPALVDARARHDQPPGITAAVKADRAAVIAEAMEEWAEDGKDEAIAQTCARMSQGMTPAGVDASRACLASDACGAYVACVTPLFEKHFTK